MESFRVGESSSGGGPPEFLSEYGRGKLASYVVLFIYLAIYVSIVIENSPIFLECIATKIELLLYVGKFLLKRKWRISVCVSSAHR